MVAGTRRLTAKGNDEEEEEQKNYSFVHGKGIKKFHILILFRYDSLLCTKVNIKLFFSAFTKARDVSKISLWYATKCCEALVPITEIHSDLCTGLLEENLKLEVTEIRDSEKNPTGCKNK